MQCKTLIQALMLLGSLMILTGTAEARSISGWGWSCCSSMEGEIDLKGVPSPKSKPTVVLADAAFGTVEILCRNPADNGVFNGQAFDAIVSDFKVLEDSDLTDNGKATVSISYDLAAFENPTYCPNANWEVVPDSPWLLDMTVSLKWYFCTGDDSEPCFDSSGLTIEDTPIDAATLLCEVPEGYERSGPDAEPPYAPPHVEYNCTLLE